MKKKTFLKGQIFGKWKLESYLGGGGNGEVWKCSTGKGDIGAIKLLKSVNEKSYIRFLDETIIMEESADIVGIIPMIDKHLPPDLKEVPFFVMPVAENAEEKLNGKSIEEKIDGFLQVCETLKELHRRGISHRDLKPANLLFYGSRFSIADFGLVDYPDKRDISFRNEEIGAKWTMAPEMRRESSKADGIKADIYSLAKTLWIILAENRKGFDGQYSTDSIIELKQFYRGTYTKPIDILLIKSTDNDPKARPDIVEFISAIEKWKVLNDDFHQRNLQQWFEIQSKLFPTGFPKRVIWEDIEGIINVLNIICSYDNLNHMFFPSGGGMDLEGAKVSNERDCIELDFQLIEIVKPKRLIFESFGDDAQWNYFRLELQELAPALENEEDNYSELMEGEKKMEKRRYDSEELSEIYPGKYDKYEILEYSDDYIEDGYELPKSARQVTRWLRGAFVIFNKRSSYNLDTSTYDGRHNEMDTDEFRKYIQRSVDQSKARKPGRSSY